MGGSSSPETASEMPRERLLKGGASQLNAAELVALCLGVGRQGEDAVTLARRALQEFGGLDGLLSAPVAQLLEIKGLGPARVARLKAVHEMGLRSLEMRASRGPKFADAAVAAAYLQRRIGFEPREHFACLFLDVRHQLLHWEVLFKGSVNQAHVHPREVLRRALEVNAAAVILSHNHPSGVAEPSQADILLTRELRGLLLRIDVRVLDHIIVAGGRYVSLADRGLLAQD